MIKVLAILLLISPSLWSAETCSRVAVINYQKVLVDSSSHKKGEGLRFYLEKDPVSKELLDKYQQKSRPTILSASTSTAGSILILAGLLQTNDNTGITNNNTLLYSGATLVALSYLISKTQQYSNERILEEAVNQYNTRNTPRIYFSPYNDNSGRSGLGFGFQQEF